MHSTYWTTVLTAGAMPVFPTPVSSCTSSVGHTTTGEGEISIPLMAGVYRQKVCTLFSQQVMRPCPLFCYAYWNPRDAPRPPFLTSVMEMLEDLDLWIWSLSEKGYFLIFCIVLKRLVPTRVEISALPPKLRFGLRWLVEMQTLSNFCSIFLHVIFSQMYNNDLMSE